jgi:hypothetical protein
MKSMPSKSLTIEDLGNDNIFKPFHTIDVSVRTSNIFKLNAIVYIGDILHHSDDALLRLPNLGKNSLLEIKTILDNHGLKLGIKIIDWPPENLHKKSKSFLPKIIKHNTQPMEELSERDNDVLRRRFCDETLEEIGIYYKVTRERVRQIEGTALKKLRNPHNIKFFKDLLKNNRSKIWNLMSGGQHILSLGDMKSFVKTSDNEEDFIFDLSTMVIYGSKNKVTPKTAREIYFKKNHDLIDKYNMVCDGFFHKDEILDSLERIEKILHSVNFPQNLGSIYSLLSMKKDLFSFCMDIYEMSHAYYFYNNYIIPRNTRDEHKYHAHLDLSSKLIDVYERLSCRDGIVRYCDAKQDCENLDAYNSYKSSTRNTIKELVNGFDRINLEHMYIHFGDSCLPLNCEPAPLNIKNSLIKPKQEIISNPATILEPLDSKITPATVIETSDIGPYMKGQELIKNLIAKQKIITHRGLLCEYANYFNLRPEQGSLIFSSILSSINNIGMVAPGIVGYLDENYNDFFDLDSFSNIPNERLSYPLDAYCWMKYASEDSLYPAATPSYEKALCAYVSKNSQHFDDKTIQSLFSVISIDSLDISESEKKIWLDRKKSSSFLLNMSIPRPLHVINSAKISSLKFINIVKMANYALFMRGISSLSANRAMGWSLLKYRLSSTQLALMALCRLIDAPKSAYMRYAPNIDNLREFCDLTNQEIKTHNFKNSTKKESAFNWSTDSGHWLLEKYKDEVTNFRHEDNWINSKFF